MPSWRSGLIPVHQNFHSTEASGDHVTFVNCTLESPAAHKIQNTAAQTASFVISGLPLNFNITAFVTGPHPTEQVTVNRIDTILSTFVIYTVGTPTPGDVISLQFTRQGILLNTITYTVLNSDSILSISNNLASLVMPSIGVYLTGLTGNLEFTAHPGDTTIFVTNASDFVVGQYVIIDPNHADQQELQIIGYQSPDKLRLSGTVKSTFPAGDVVQQTSASVAPNTNPVDSGAGTPPNNNTITTSALTTVSGGGGSGGTSNSLGRHAGSVACYVNGMLWNPVKNVFISWMDGANKLADNTSFWQVRDNSYVPYADAYAYMADHANTIPGGGGARYALQRMQGVDTSGNTYYNGFSQWINHRFEFTGALNNANADLMNLWYSTASGTWAMADLIPGNGVTMDGTGQLWQSGWQYELPFHVGGPQNLDPAVYTVGTSVDKGQDCTPNEIWGATRAYQALLAWYPFGIVGSTTWDASGPLYYFDDTCKDPTTPPAFFFSGSLSELGSFGSTATGIAVGASRALATQSVGSTAGYLFAGASSGTTAGIAVFDRPVDTPLYSVTIPSTSTVVQILPIVGGNNAAVPQTYTIGSSLFTTGPTQFSATVLPVGYQYLSGAPQGSEFSTDSNGAVTIINGAPIGTTGVYLGPADWTVTYSANVTVIPCFALMADGDVYYVHLLSGSCQKLTLGMMAQHASVDITGQYLYVVPMTVRPGTNDGNTHATGASSVTVFQLTGANKNQTSIIVQNGGTITPTLYSDQTFGPRNANVYTTMCCPSQPLVALFCSDDILICPTGEVDASITQ